MPSGPSESEMAGMHNRGTALLRFSSCPYAERTTNAAFSERLIFATTSLARAEGSALPVIDWATQGQFEDTRAAEFKFEERDRFSPDDKAVKSVTTRSPESATPGINDLLLRRSATGPSLIVTFLIGSGRHEPKARNDWGASPLNQTKPSETHLSKT